MNHLLALVAAPLSLGLILGACTSVVPATDEAAASEAFIATGATFFFVDRTASHDGYVTRTVNNTPVDCGGVLSDRCAVDDVDLSVFSVSASDQASILANVRGESAPNTIILGGALTNDDRGRRVLVVSEAWRAPDNARWSGTVYNVSRSGIACVAAGCRASNAVTINTTRIDTVPDVILGETAGLAHCRFVPLLWTGCSRPYQAAEAEEATAIGLFVAGYRDSRLGIIAEQYFLKMGAGEVCDDGGFHYCSVNQTCDPKSGVCVCNTEVCKHGRGRGV